MRQGGKDLKGEGSEEKGEFKEEERGSGGGGCQGEGNRITK